MEKTYLIQMAYSGVGSNGVNYQYQTAKNKKMAIMQAIKSVALREYKLIFLSIKRVPKTFVKMVEKHNEEFIKFKPKGESNE